MVFAFYGSLRPGQYNFDRFDLDSISKLLGTHVVEKYKMVSVNDWYPMVFPSEDIEDSVVVDLVEIKDQRTIRYIDSMEIGAGYEPQQVTINNIDCTLYIGSNSTPKRIKEALIPSGDWVKYNTEKEHGVRTSRV